MSEFNKKIQMCNLSDSLLRNINDNFRNVSFDLLKNGNIQVKVILKVQTDVEIEYIDDISAEFSALQDSNIVEKFEVTTNLESPPLANIVYNHYD